MRKSFVLTLGLLACSLAVLCLVPHWVNQGKEAVVIDETVLYGDESAAADITVRSRCHYKHHLFWDTDYRVGEPALSQTAFTFSSEADYGNADFTYPGVSFASFCEAVYNAARGDALETDDLGFLSNPYEDVASRTADGEEHTEIIDLKDYFDTYPIFVTLAFPNYHVSYQETAYETQPDRASNSAAVLRDFADYFRIPLNESLLLEITVRKDEAGYINSAGRATVNGWYDLSVQNVLTDAGCYFTFQNLDQNGEPLDMSLLPDGYGLYYLPYERADDGTIIGLGSLSMVFPIDPGAVFITLCATSDQSRLLLTTLEGTRYMLTIIDTATRTQLQKLELFDCPEEDGYWKAFIFEDFFVPVLYSGRFAVFAETESGAYTRQLTGDYSEIDELRYSINYATTMAFDGEKLAIVAPLHINEPNYYGTLCGYYLAVFDTTGLTYLGKYAHSLDVGTWEDASRRCLPIGSHPLTVMWTAPPDEAP